MPLYAIQVTDKDGYKTFLTERVTRSPVRFPSHAAAARELESRRATLDSDVQEVRVVKYPKEKPS